MLADKTKKHLLQGIDDVYKLIVYKFLHLCYSICFSQKP